MASHRRNDHVLLLCAILGCAAVGALAIVLAAGYGTGLLLQVFR